MIEESIKAMWETQVKSYLNVDCYDAEVEVFHISTSANIEKYSIKITFKPKYTYLEAKVKLYEQQIHTTLIDEI